MNNLGGGSITEKAQRMGRIHGSKSLGTLVLCWCCLQVLMLDQQGWRQNMPVHSHTSVSFSPVPQPRTCFTLVSGESSAAQQKWQREAQHAGAYSRACLPGDCSDLCLNQPWERKEITSRKAQA